MHEKNSVIIYFRSNIDNSNMKCTVRVIHYKILPILPYLLNLQRDGYFPNVLRVMCPFLFQVIIEEMLTSVIKKYVKMDGCQYLRDYRMAQRLKMTAESRKRVIDRNEKHTLKSDSIPFQVSNQSVHAMPGTRCQQCSHEYNYLI